MVEGQQNIDISTVLLIVLNSYQISNEHMEHNHKLMIRITLQGRLVWIAEILQYLPKNLLLRCNHPIYFLKDGR